MSKYEFNNNRFKKDGKRISKEDISKELNKEQFNTLIKNGKYSTRSPYKTQTKINGKITQKNSEPPIISNPNEKPNIITKNTEITYINHDIKKENFIPSKKELKEAQKIKDLYRVEKNFYPKKGYTYDLWRYNKKFGYYNFTLHINGDTEEDILNGIVQDLRNQKEEAERKIITSF